MHATRPYQSQAVAAVESHLSAGAGAVCLVGPTGSGKSLMGAECMRPAATFLAVAHRHELLGQLRATFQERGIEGGRFESVQSLAASGVRPDVARVFWDETHHAISAPHWSAVANHYRSRRVPIVGATATPVRSDGAAFGSLFSAMVVAATLRGLTQDGYLARARVYAPATPRQHMAEYPSQAYHERAPHSRAVVFCRDVKHAEDEARRFSALGYSAACVEGRMGPVERKAAFDGFASGALEVLTNVALVVEGIDVPACETVIHARNVGSVAAWLQMNGRALRVAEGKAFATIIDLLGSVYQHGLPDAEREFSLDGTAITTRDLGHYVAICQCGNCGMVAEARQYEDGVCPYCGEKRKAKPDPRVKRARLQVVRAGHVEEQRVLALAELLRRCVLGGRARRLAKGMDRETADRKGAEQARVLYRQAYSEWPSADVMSKAVAVARNKARAKASEAVQLPLLGGT